MEQLQNNRTTGVFFVKFELPISHIKITTGVFFGCHLKMLVKILTLKNRKMAKCGDNAT
jgi:hypothetical protein